LNECSYDIVVEELKELIRILTKPRVEIHNYDYQNIQDCGFGETIDLGIENETYIIYEGFIQFEQFRESNHHRNLQFFKNLFILYKGLPPIEKNKLINECFVVIKNDLEYSPDFKLIEVGESLTEANKYYGFLNSISNSNELIIKYYQYSQEQIKSFVFRIKRYKWHYHKKILSNEQKLNETIRVSTSNVTRGEVFAGLEESFLETDSNQKKTFNSQKFDQKHFSFKKKPNSNEVNDIFQLLKDKKYIEYNQNAKIRFKKIFSGAELAPSERINWLKTKYSLAEFIKFLQPLVKERNVFQISNHIFTHQGKSLGNSLNNNRNGKCELLSKLKRLTPSIKL